MQKIGMFEAKTHLPKIIREVQKGEEVCLTNRNQPIAYIISTERYHKEKNTFALDELKKLLQISPLGSSEEIIEMKEIGRK